MSGGFLEVSPQRVGGWLERFAAAHGELRWQVQQDDVVFRAVDGSVARCAVPFPPLQSEPDLPYAGLVAHATAHRRVGVLLVRRGGFAAGVFDGTALVASKVGSRHVQGRTAAGGWSQQRFARRRENQARAAFAAAADAAVRVLVEYDGGGPPSLDAVVTGGDRRAVGGVLADERLAALRPLVVARVIDVPEPRQRTLAEALSKAAAVRLTVTPPEAPHPGPDGDRG